MRFAKEGHSGRESGGSAVCGASWSCRPRCCARRRVGAWAVARTVRSGADRQKQCGGLYGDAGLSRQPGRRSVVLVARGDGATTGLSPYAWTGRNRDRPQAAGAGCAARSGGLAACGGRRGSLYLRRSGGDRVMAPSSCARPDRKSPIGTGGGSIGRHHIASPGRGGAQSQCCADALEHPRGAFRCAGGGGARSAYLHRRLVAPAWASGWRILASGMGS